MLQRDNKRLNRLSVVVTFWLFVSFCSCGLLFYEKRKGVLAELDAFTNQLSLTEKLLIEFNNQCKKDEFLSYFAFQDHALTSYKIHVSRAIGFPYYAGESYLAAQKLFEESLVALDRGRKSCL